MSSFIKVDEKKYFFEYIITEGYLIYGGIEKYKFEVDRNNLEDLAFTFHDHIKHWQSTEKAHDINKYKFILEFLLTENTYPFELEENAWNEMGLEGEIVAISDAEIIVKLSKGELFIDLKSDNLIKNIVLDSFQENEIELAIGESVELYECDTYYFITEEQRAFWVKTYIDKIEKLNFIYQHNNLETIKII